MYGYSNTVLCRIDPSMHHFFPYLKLICVVSNDTVRFRERRVIAVDGDSADPREDKPNRMGVFGANVSQ